MTTEETLLRIETKEEMEPILEKIPESVKRRMADDYLVNCYLSILCLCFQMHNKGKNDDKRKGGQKY